MMKMTFMIHPHLHGPTAMYTGLCGLNNFLIIKATTHLLCCLPKDMLWLPSMAMIEASQWDIFVGRAMAKVLFCHLLEVEVPVIQMVKMMELIVDMDVVLQDVLEDVLVVMDVDMAMVAKVKDFITIIVHSCSHMMITGNILISSLVP